MPLRPEGKFGARKTALSRGRLGWRTLRLDIYKSMGPDGVRP